MKHSWNRNTCRNCGAIRTTARTDRGDYRQTFSKDGEFFDRTPPCIEDADEEVTEVPERPQLFVAVAIPPNRATIAEVVCEEALIPFLHAGLTALQQPLVGVGKTVDASYATPPPDGFQGLGVMDIEALGGEFAIQVSGLSGMADGRARFYRGIDL